MSEIGLMPPPSLLDVDEEAACFVCGCTDDVACPGGCAWAEDAEAEMLDVCSACVALRDHLVDAGRPITLQRLAEWTPAQREEALYAG